MKLTVISTKGSVQQFQDIDGSKIRKPATRHSEQVNSPLTILLHATIWSKQKLNLKSLISSSSVSVNSIGKSLGIRSPFPNPSIFWSTPRLYCDFFFTMMCGLERPASPSENWSSGNWPPLWVTLPLFRR
jgi:hypothetical protein